MVCPIFPPLVLQSFPIPLPLVYPIHDFLQFTPSSTFTPPASIGRTELEIFLGLYLLTLPLQLVTTGAFLHQGSTALVVLTAIHAGAVAATFWALLGNAIVSTQLVEDGTLSSLIVRLLFPYPIPHFLTFFSTAIRFLLSRLLCRNNLHLPRSRILLHFSVRPLLSPSQST